MKYRDPVVAGPLMSDMKFKKKTPRFRIEVGGGGGGGGGFGSLLPAVVVFITLSLAE